MLGPRITREYFLENIASGMNCIKIKIKVRNKYYKKII